MAGRGLDARHPVLIGAVALGVYALDQGSKSWAVHRLSDGSTVDVIGSLRFNLAFNSGAAFSQGTGFGPVIALVAMVVVIALVWTGRSATSRVSAVAVGLIVGGAVGNLSDRLLRSGPGGLFGGAVADFIDVQWWPVFNVADSAIVVGGVLLLLSTALAPGDTSDGDGDGGEADVEAGDPGTVEPDAVAADQDDAETTA